jgi:hypothetical protein
MRQESNWIPVEFYMETKVRKGFLHIPSELRILDLLNRTGSVDRDILSEYIEFMTVLNPQNDEHKEAQYIRKDAVNLVAIADINTARGAGGKPPPKVYPVSEKAPLRISVEIPGVTLQGDMHRLPRQTVRDVLDEKSPFLPLTNVMIAPEGHDEETRPFVAIRKAQILLLKEEKQPDK